MKEIVHDTPVLLPLGPLTQLPWDTEMRTYIREDGWYEAHIRIPGVDRVFKAVRKTEIDAEEAAARHALVYVD